MSFLALAASPLAAQCPLGVHAATSPVPNAGAGLAVALEGDSLWFTGVHWSSGNGGGYHASWDGAQWVQDSSITVGSIVGASDFGRHLALEGDLLLASAQLIDGNFGATIDSGAVRQLTTAGSGWSSGPTILASDGDTGDEFGSGVALSGELAAIGAWREDAGGVDAGAVYVFRDSGAGLQEVQKLIASDAQPAGLFGASVALDGGWLAVGATDETGATGGAIYVFELVGPLFVERQKLLAPGGQPGDELGATLCLDGGVLAAGAPNAGASVGAIHLWELTGGTWQYATELAPPAGVPGARFGSALDVDGSQLVVGAPLEPLGLKLEAGAAYYYRKINGSWELIMHMTNPAGNPTGHRFGSGVGLSGDKLVVGIPGGNPGGAMLAGSVRTYDVEGAGLVLDGCPFGVSVTSGGQQDLTLDAGPAHAGELFLVLGSLSGTSPGIALGGEVVPLNPDAYLLHTAAAHPAPMQPPLGTLDGQGTASLAFALGAGVVQPSFAGVTAHHAALLLDPVTIAIRLVSNAEGVDLLP